MLLKHRRMRRSLDVESTPAPVSTLTTSVYWGQSPPDVLRQAIARRMAEPGVKHEVAKAISNERLEFKTIWNRSLPINQLPNELLTYIFNFHMHYYLATTIDMTSAGTFETPNWRFWRLMRVCRHWRELIVGTPAFWSSVHLTKATNWTELCLDRSVPAPIDVLARIPAWCRVAHLSVVYPLVHRIESLYFRVHVKVGDMDPDVLAALALLFGDGMPGLERLDLAITHDKRRPYHLPIGFDVDLTCQRFPHLRRLALTRVVAPQDAPLYTQLQTLSLTTCSHNLSFDGFLDALASCTGLRRLHLDNTLDRLSGDWMQRDRAHSRPLVSFPHLNSFALSGHGAVCTSRFLAHFHIHSSVRMGISADAEDIEEADSPSSNGPHSVAAMLPPSHAVTLEPLGMAKDIHMWMSFGRGVEIHTPVTLPTVVYLGMQLAADAPYGTATPSRWGSVADLVQFLGRAPLTSLRVSHVLPDTVAAWAGVFRTFPLLERLSIHGFLEEACAVGMEHAFLGLHAASAADPDSPVACPNLAHVSVRGHGNMAVYEAIRTCIRHRGDRGVVLVELNLRDLWRGWGLSRAQCRACVKDIVDCTERLSLPEISLDESEEGENLRADSGRRQGDTRC
ncbi:hypothetical protein LXA43DRAFT_197435 [Ganoderma leucocontextum]|nr:hypothetical protein LXA43DRAFT_197435 [Ganoderma leucocontextum]